MEIERFIEAASRGFAAGLLKALTQTADAPAVVQPARRKPPKRRTPKARDRQLPLSPELQADLRESFVPPNPRSPMDDYETAVPSAQQLDTLFAGADPENEAIAALRRQMRMQAAAAAEAPPKKPVEAPAFSWGVSDS